MPVSSRDPGADSWENGPGNIGPAAEAGPPVKRTQTLEFSNDGTYRNLNVDTVISQYRDQGGYYEIFETIPSQIPDTLKSLRFYRIKDGQLQPWSDNVDYSNAGVRCALPVRDRP